MKSAKIKNLALETLGESSGDLAEIMLSNISVSPPFLYDHSEYGFHLILGQVSSGNDGGVLLNTDKDNPSLQFRNSAQLKFIPEKTEGAQCWVFLTADSANYEEFEGYLELKSNMGDVKFGGRAIEFDDNRFLFIIDDIDQPNSDGLAASFTLEYVVKNNTMDHEWNFVFMDVEFRKFAP